MVLIDGKQRRLTITFIYVGPEGAGRRTSLRSIAERWRTPVRTRQRVWGRSSFVESGTILQGPTGFKIGLRVLCPWRLPLNPRPFESCFSAVDGVIFVADSQLRMLESNQEALIKLNAGLETIGRPLSQIAHGFQWNKCEMPDAILAQDLDRRLNRYHAPTISSTALLSLNVTGLLFDLGRQIVERQGMELSQDQYQIERLRKAVGRKRWPLNE